MRRGTTQRSLGSATTVFASDVARLLLERNDLAHIDAVFAQGAAVRRRHKGRKVWEARLTPASQEPRGRNPLSREPDASAPSANAQDSIRVFVKMHWGRQRLWPRMSDLKTGQTFQTLPIREWHGLHRLTSLGLNVAQPLALYHDGRWRFRSAVVMTAVPPKDSVNEMIRHGEWSALLPQQREALFDAMLAAVERIHSAGLGWRGISSRHFYPQLREDGAWSVWLIDCEGIHGRATRRAFDRNLRKLIRSIKQSGADAVTLRLLETKISELQQHGSAKAA